MLENALQVSTLLENLNRFFSGWVSYIKWYAWSSWNDNCNAWETLLHISAKCSEMQQNNSPRNGASTNTKSTCEIRLLCGWTEKEHLPWHLHYHVQRSRTAAGGGTRALWGCVSVVTW